MSPKRSTIYHPLHYLITNNVNDLNLNLNTPVLNNTNVEIPWIYLFIIREIIVGYEYAEFSLYLFGKSDIFFFICVANYKPPVVINIFVLHCWTSSFGLNIVDIFWVLSESSICLLLSFTVDKRPFSEYHQSILIVTCIIYFVI